MKIATFKGAVSVPECETALPGRRRCTVTSRHGSTTKLIEHSVRCTIATLEAGKVYLI